MRRRARVATIGAAVLALVAGACGTDKDPLELGLKRVSLDLAFKDAEKAVPLEPQKVIQLIEYFDEEVALDEPNVVRRSVPRARVEPPCIPAPPGTTSREPVYGVADEPPKVGTYRRANEGTIAIEAAGGAAFPPINRPYPPRSNWDITDLKFGSGPFIANPEDDFTGVGEATPKDVPRPDNAVPPADVAPAWTSFKLTRHLSFDSRTIDTFVYFGDRGRIDLEGENTSTDMDGDGLYLIKRERISSTLGNSVFVPTPPVLFVPIGDESKATEPAIVGSGIDRTTNAAMTVSSKVLTRESIDVCGEVIDGYRVQFEEQFTDLSSGTPVTSGNLQTGKPNVWHVAFNRGLLILQEENHTVLNTTMTILGQQVPVTVKYDYVSTLQNEEPLPLALVPGQG